MAIPTAPPRDVVVANCRPRFGTSNPERVDNAFWEWAIRAEMNPHTVRQAFKIPHDLTVQKSHMAQSSYREQENGPVWTFERFGMAQVHLGDGRTVHVAGEHEDWYDPDFCIYNDVVVRGPDDEIEIHAYPADVFPPTDFHTATRVDDAIFLIGSVGYKDQRQAGVTPVYRLDLATMAISAVDVAGDGPGWVSDHEALHDPDDNCIVLTGGKRWVIDAAGTGRFEKVIDDYVLDLHMMTWRKCP